jgi:hypothetical protein
MDLTVSAALTRLKTAMDTLKAINDSTVRLDEAQSRLKLVELMSPLADIRMDLTNIQQAMTDKDCQIAQLKEQLSVKQELQFEPPYYWLSNGATKEGPFCQVCYDKNQELIRLQGGGKAYRLGYWECKACKNSYKDDSYEVESVHRRYASSSRLRNF